MKETVNLFKALADETRLRILSLLLTHGELCVCDLIAALQLPQSTVSRHLAYLRKSGWVNDRRCGVWMYYSLGNAETLLHERVSGIIAEHLAAHPATTADRARLASFVRDNTCA